MMRLFHLYLYFWEHNPVAAMLLTGAFLLALLATVQEVYIANHKRKFTSPYRPKDRYEERERSE